MPFYCEVPFDASTRQTKNSHWINIENLSKYDALCKISRHCFEAAFLFVTVVISAFIQHVHSPWIMCIAFLDAHEGTRSGLVSFTLSILQLSSIFPPFLIGSENSVRIPCTIFTVYRDNCYCGRSFTPFTQKFQAYFYIFFISLQKKWSQDQSLD